MTSDWTSAAAGADAYDAFDGISAAAVEAFIAAVGDRAHQERSRLTR